MKHVLLAGCAALALAGPAAAQEAVLSTQGAGWDGAYWGAFAAGISGSTNWDKVSSTNFSSLGDNVADFTVDGWGLGALVGFNSQNGSLVYAVEADITFVDASGDGLGGVSSNNRPHTMDVNALATLTARLGHTVGSGLVYGEAGAALIDHDLSHTNGAGTVFSGDELALGWVVGIGYEHMMGNGWAIRAEYNYMDFSGTSASLSGGGATLGYDIDTTIDRFILGGTRRF